MIMTQTVLALSEHSGRLVPNQPNHPSSAKSKLPMYQQQAHHRARSQRDFGRSGQAWVHTLSDLQWEMGHVHHTPVHCSKIDELPIRMALAAPAEVVGLAEDSATGTAAGSLDSSAAEHE